MLKLVLTLIVTFGIAATALADPPPKKKPVYPPPEESASVGVLGAHKPAGDAASAKPAGPPPPVAAAPAIEKVEAETPSSLEAVPREVVRGEDATINGSGATAYRLPIAKPSGFLPDHPWLSGLVAGLIGSDLGSRLYGGPMVGDSDAATAGYAIRIALILGLAVLLFRLIGRRTMRGDARLAPVAPVERREPGFGRSEPTIEGRREPHFGNRD